MSLAHLLGTVAASMLVATSGWPRVPTLADFPNIIELSSGTMTPSEDGSGIYISSMDSSSATRQYGRWRTVDLSVSGRYISGRLQATFPAKNYRANQIIVGLSDGRWIRIGPTYDNGNKIGVTEFNSSWVFTTHKYGPSATHYGKEYFRVINSSGTINFQVSSDNVTWTTLYSGSYTINKAGIMLDSSTNSDGGALKKISLLLWDEN